MNRIFVSIRWKLVSTYLLLAMLTLLAMIALINASLTDYFVENKKAVLITQATVIADRTSQLIGTAPKEIIQEELTALIKSYSLNYETRIMVVNNNGDILTDSFDDYKGVNIASIDEVQSAINGNTSANLYNFDDFGQTFYVSVPMYESTKIIGAIFLSDAPIEIYRDINHILDNLYWIAVLIIIVAVVLSLLLANIFAEPIVDLTRVVKRVSIGQTHEKAKIYNNDELGILTDATNKMLAKQIKVDDMRKGFVSNVSHELRTPITSLKIIAQTMLNSKPDNVAVYEDFMVDIESELDRLNQIIDTLLESTNLENQDIKLHLEPFSINEIVRDAVRTLLPIAEKQSIALNFTPKITPEIKVDKLKIRQVVINLVNNALKYTDKGGTVDVEIVESRNEICVNVKDTGMGIAGDDIPHLFDRFYRVDSARARDTGGSGLGLSIARQIMVLHGGGIDVQSELGEGSVFSIVFLKSKNDEGEMRR